MDFTPALTDSEDFSCALPEAPRGLRDDRIVPSWVCVRVSRRGSQRLCAFIEDADIRFVAKHLSALSPADFMCNAKG